MAALPLNVMAANISGAMYTAPSAANNDHPAPTTQAAAPFGRIDIDTADQDHIATTAYVKGAYNSAIAAVNKVNSEKQDKFNGVYDKNAGQQIVGDYFGASNYGELESFFDSLSDNTVLTTDGTIAAIGEAVNLQRVLVYTTWDDDSAKIGVPLANEIGFQQQIY